MSPIATVTLSSRWLVKRTQCKVIVTRVFLRRGVLHADDRSFCGKVPEWQFLDQFQPMRADKKKPRSVSASPVSQKRPSGNQ